MVDVIAELINNLKTASAAGKATASFPYSKMRESILVTLEKAGFIKSFSKKGKKVIKTLEVELAYEDDKSPKIQGAQQVSKYSRRLYYKADEIYPVRNGYGSLVITTPKGVMTDREARKEKVGGEPLFKIW
jgi:small subunit ribosomal protein S8